MRHDRRSDSGYTLTEVMFVVLILAVLVSIAVVAFSASTARAERTACRANVRVLQGAVYAFQADTGGSLPTTLTDIDPFVLSPEIYDGCPSDDTVHYEYDPTTGIVTCALHP